jgi:hypothetical protein
MGYQKALIPPKVTAICNILNHTLIYSISLLPSIVVYHHHCSQNMSTNGYSPKKVNMAHPGDVFGAQQRSEDTSKSSEKSSQSAPTKDSVFGKQTNQYHPPHGFGNLSSQQPLTGAPLFHEHFPINKTHSSQPTTGASQGNPSFGPQWQGYDLHQDCYGGSQMFPPPQTPGQGLSFPGALRVPPEPLEYDPTNGPTSSTSNTLPEPPSGALVRPLISLLRCRF